MFFPGRMFATNRVFYLDTGPSEAMRHVRNHSRSSKDQVTLNYLKLLGLQYFKHVTNVLSEVPYFTIGSKEEGEIGDTGAYENHLLSFVKSTVVDYD